MLSKPPRVALDWAASTDAVGVVGYRVYRDGALVGTTSGTAYTDNPGGKKGMAYRYYVVAYDAAGNVSAPSTAASIGT
jgi:fibronectin type 3 domain-containing protein